MAVNKNDKPTTLGATTEAGRAREADFKSRLKNFFPGIRRIDFQYTEIKKKPSVTGIEIKDRGCFGYFMKESIMIDGESISIAWLPHVKDMSPKHIEWIVDKIVNEEEEVEEEEEEEEYVDLESTNHLGVVE